MRYSELFGRAPARRRFAAILLGVVLLINAPFARAAQVGGDGAPKYKADPIGQVFLEARLTPTSVEKIAASLVRVPNTGIPELFETLRRTRFYVRVGENGNSSKQLTKIEREALVEALNLHPWREVNDFLDELRKGQFQESERLAAIRVLGALGTSDDFWDLLRWSEPLETGTRVPRNVRSAFELSLETMLNRVPRGVQKMPSLYASANLSLVPPIISTLGRHSSAESLDQLAKMLGKVPAADTLVLAEISQLGDEVLHPINWKTREQVRYSLENQDAAVRVEAIIACSRIGDTDAVPRLIELLSETNPNIKTQALKALKQITTQFYGYDPSDWNEWYEKTNRWHRDRAPDLLNQIATGNTSTTSRAVLECSKQRFFRHELAPKIAACLTRQDEELIILTCATLGHLGSPLAISDLLRSLSHHSVNVRRAALLALKRITGEDHGEHSQDWVTAGW